MNIRVEIRQTDAGSAYGGLHVSEDLPFEANTFSDLCGVLTRFHDLAEEIRRLAGKKNA